MENTIKKTEIIANIEGFNVPNFGSNYPIEMQFERVADTEGLFHAIFARCADSVFANAEAKRISKLRLNAAIHNYLHTGFLAKKITSINA